MSLSVIPLTILGQITGVSGSGDTVLYQVSFKSIDGTPLYGVTAVWTDEQAEIEALAAQKPYGVWINPIDGTFTVKFAGYTYVGSADLTDPDVLAGVTPIEFTSAEVSDRLLPEEPLVLNTFPEELQQILMTSMETLLPSVISANGNSVLAAFNWLRTDATNVEDFDAMGENIAQIALSDKRINAYYEENGVSVIQRDVIDIDQITSYHIALPDTLFETGGYHFSVKYSDISYSKGSNSNPIIGFNIIASLITEID